MKFIQLGWAVVLGLSLLPPAGAADLFRAKVDRDVETTEAVWDPVTRQWSYRPGISFSSGTELNLKLEPTSQKYHRIVTEDKTVLWIPKEAVTPISDQEVKVAEKQEARQVEQFKEAKPSVRAKRVRARDLEFFKSRYEYALSIAPGSPSTAFKANGVSAKSGNWIANRAGVMFPIDRRFQLALGVGYQFGTAKSGDVQISSAGLLTYGELFYHLVHVRRHFLSAYGLLGLSLNSVRVESSAERVTTSGLWAFPIQLGFNYRYFITSRYSAGLSLGYQIFNVGSASMLTDTNGNNPKAKVDLSGVVLTGIFFF